jgi:hypothetical protein
VIGHNCLLSFVHIYFHRKCNLLSSHPSSSLHVSAVYGHHQALSVLLKLLHSKLYIVCERDISSARFEVFTAVTMKNVVFWNVAPCRPCVNRLLSAATSSCWFLARGFFYPADGGDTFLLNVDSHKMYTAPHPRRQHSSRHFLIKMN